MALGNGWSAKAPLTIDSSKVTATVTDLPIIITYANLPTEITDSSGGCLDDGADIRFTADIDGVTEYARDIISVDKTSDIVTCYVKIPSISSTVDTTFYIWWNNPNATEPSETGDSGSRTCWSDYYGVFHYKNITEDWKGIPDASGSWSAQTVIGTSSTSEGHVEGTSCVNLDSDFGITLHEDFGFNGGRTNDIMFWTNLNGSGVSGNIAEGFNGIPWGWVGSGQFGAGWGNVSTSGGAIPTSGWQHVWFRNVAGTCRAYVNGVDKTQGTTTTQSEQWKNWGLGDATSPAWDCSELRATRDINHSVDKVLVMVANESDPSTFISAGTPIIVTASLTITIKVVDQVLNPIETAQVYIDEDFVDPQIMNKSTDANGEASITYDGAQVSATLRVRKYGYKAFTTPIDISINDIAQTVTMITDPQQT